MKNELPKHIGIIMDGNRRWAKQRNLEAKDGHRAGLENLSKVVEAAADRGVEIITVYAFSTENLKKRSAKEVYALFELLIEGLRRQRKRLNGLGVNLSFFGELKALPGRVQRNIKEAMNVLKHNERIKCNIMFNYGGRSEIIKAMKEIMLSGKAADEINEELISQHLYTKGLPDPDLIIRTGGDFRLSNFLIWQMSYSELYFTDVLWPDFDEKALDAALEDYAQRSRRYGGQDVAKPTKI
jgi:undecaprenyl diphosphate synthase